MDINVAGLNKVYCFVSSSSYNGRTVKITDSINTWTKTISSLSCVFMIPSMPAPAKKSYTVMLMNSAGTAAEYSRGIELGFGDSIKIGLFTNDENADKAYVLSEINSHAYSLPTAASGTKGGVKVTSGTANGVYMDGEQLKTYLASSSQIGCMKTGTGLTASSGTVSLNTADSSNLGGIKIGNGLQMSSGTASVKTAAGLDVSSSGVYLKPAGSGSSSNLGGVYIDSNSGLYLNSSGRLSLREERTWTNISKSITISSNSWVSDSIEIPSSNAAYSRIVNHGFIEAISTSDSSVFGFVKQVIISSSITVSISLYNKASSSSTITSISVWYAYFY